MEQQTGTCKYCGQTGIINTTGVADDEWVDEQVTLSCTCTKAKHLRKMNSLYEDIEIMLEDFPEVIEIVKASAELVSVDEIYSMSLNTGKKEKISITKDSKGNLKIKKTRTTQQEINA